MENKEFFEWKDEMESNFNKLSEKIIVINTEIESLVVSLDINREIVESLDNIGVAIYKLYNKIKGIIEQ